MTEIVVEKTERTIVVETDERNVVVSEEGLPGPVGPPGPAGGEAFIHTQSTPADTWTINHNLGRRPTIEVYTVGWVNVEAAVVHTSVNQAVVQLNQPLDGFATCA